MAEIDVRKEVAAARIIMTTIGRHLQRKAQRRVLCILIILRCLRRSATDCCGIDDGGDRLLDAKAAAGGVVEGMARDRHERPSIEGAAARVDVQHMRQGLHGRLIRLFVGYQSCS